MPDLLRNQWPRDRQQQAMETNRHRTPGRASAIIRFAVAFNCLAAAAVSVMLAFQTPQRGVFLDPQSQSLEFAENEDLHFLETTLFNNSNLPINITKAITSCGCALVHQVEGARVANGQSFNIPVEWNIPAGRKSAGFEMLIQYQTATAHEPCSGTLVFRCIGVAKGKRKEDL